MFPWHSMLALQSMGTGFPGPLLLPGMIPGRSCRYKGSNNKSEAKKALQKALFQIPRTLDGQEWEKTGL